VFSGYWLPSFFPHRRKKCNGYLPHGALRIINFQDLDCYCDIQSSEAQKKKQKKDCFIERIVNRLQSDFCHPDIRIFQCLEIIDGR